MARFLRHTAALCISGTPTDTHRATEFSILDEAALHQVDTEVLSYDTLELWTIPGRPPISQYTVMGDHATDDQPHVSGPVHRTLGLHTLRPDHILCANPPLTHSAQFQERDAWSCLGERRLVLQ